MKRIISYLLVIVTLSIIVGNRLFVPAAIAESSEREIQEKAISMIEEIVADISSRSDYELIFLSYFTPSDKASPHYRVEFRLSAFDDAIGMSYSIKGYPDIIIDFVGDPSYFEDDIEIRLYSDTLPKEIALDLMMIGTYAMDPKVEEKDFDFIFDVINLVGDAANGYYVGDVCVGYSFNFQTKLYSLFLKKTYEVQEEGQEYYP